MPRRQTPLIAATDDASDATNAMPLMLMYAARIIASRCCRYAASMRARYAMRQDMLPAHAPQHEAPFYAAAAATLRTRAERCGKQRALRIYAIFVYAA